ncbi:ATP-binding protein [Chloroflexota bacterium]
MWQVIGQDGVVSLLRRALEKDSLGHAYLFTGPAHVGKMTLAVDLARALNCPVEERPCGECESCRKIAAGSHADVQVIGLAQDENNAEAKLISIDQIRQAQHAASLPPFEGKCRVFIIDGAELLSIEAANCLLKTLEEPGDNVVFLLLAVAESLLLDTVISRCQRLELRPASVAEVASVLNSSWAVDTERVALLARLAHGCMGWAVQAVNDTGLMERRETELNDILNAIRGNYEERFAYVARLVTAFSRNRARVYDLLGLWLDYWRDLLMVKLGLHDLITNIDRLDVIQEMAGNSSLSQVKDFIEGIQQAGAQLERNANPRLVLEVLMLDIPGKEDGRRENLSASYR